MFALTTVTEFISTAFIRTNNYTRHSLAPATLSSAAITAVAVLESPRQVEGQPKSVVFDAQIYQGLGQQPLVAHLHYFNKYNMSFLDDVGVYFLHAMVAKAVEDAELLRSNDNIVYNLVGDIKFLIPASKTEPTYLLWVHIVGTVSGTPEKDTFDIDAAQYTAALKAHKAKSCLPVLCFVKDSPRYAKYNKPVPRANSQVCCGGFLTSADRKTEDSVPSRFRLNIDNVTFLGQSTVPAKSSSTGDADDSQPSVKCVPGLKYDWSTSTWAAKRFKPDANNNGSASAASSSGSSQTLTD
ncbi:hypothetical protein FIBSPDRAFT_963772 [Athelia psychrophila]|uniref:Uncharacterized protein n=1 Tax=Athelia psychrophila TaxID=1759441 RepID=A0A165YK97_9AGAM|nr:hypothetical protein FIBSPDRAFT_963772 [Fibularhizoctonia sp. CBS 109695]